MTLPPGPVGPQHARLNAQFFQRDPLGFLGHLSGTFGDVSRFDLGAGPIVFVHDADLVRAFFRCHEADLRKPEFLRASNCGHWGDGLTTLNDPEVWRARRQILRPLFRASLRAPRLALVPEIVHSTTANWEEGQPIDLAHEMRLLTTRIALRTVLDADLEGCCDGDGRSGLVPYLEGYGEDFTAVVSGTNGTVQMTRPRAPRNMDRVLAIIQARFGDRTDRGDVLSALANAHRAAPRAFTQQDILGEIIQMLYAGHLTIPFALTQFWHDIARYGLDRQLADEATAVDAAEPHSAATLGTSRVMAILRESMRMSAPAPILYREVARSFPLSGFHLTEGQGVWTSPGLLHRDPRYFPQPSEFLSDRFAAGRLPPVSAKAYMPFGAGPRVCIAASQSLSQMAVIILSIACRFRLKPIAGTAGQFEVRQRTPA